MTRGNLIVELRLIYLVIYIYYIYEYVENQEKRFKICFRYIVSQNCSLSISLISSGIVGF